MQCPINILYVHTSLDTGGAQAARYLFLKYLNNKNIKVSICCLGKKGAYGLKLEELGYQVDVFNSKYGFFNVAATFKLYKYIKTGKFDIVQSSLFFANYHTAIAGFLARISKFIIEEHGEHNFHLRKRHIFYRIIGHYIAKMSKMVICCNESMKLELAKVYNIPLRKICVLKNAIDDKIMNLICTREEMRKKMGISANSLVVGTVGSLSWIKNQEFLIDCFARINRKDKYLVLVGDGPLKQKLVKYADGLEVGDKVYFTGWREDVADILNIFDIFVLTSFSEGLPISLLEAMSMGLPCIATRVGGIPEVLKDDTFGKLVSPDNTEQLLDAINDMSCNMEKAKKIGAAAREFVLKDFSVPEYINNMLKIYKAEE